MVHSAHTVVVGCFDVGHHGSVGRVSDVGSNSTCSASKLRQFVYPLFSVSFIIYLADGPFYLVSHNGRGNERSHTGGKCVTCHGLHSCRKGKPLKYAHNLHEGGVS